MKKVLSLVLCLSLLLPLFSTVIDAGDGAVSAVDLDATLTEAKDGATAVITMTYDDGSFSTAEWLTEEYARYGLSGSCMMIVKNNIADTYNPENTNYLAWKALYEKGYLEPESHTMTHTVLPSQSWANSNSPSSIYNNTQVRYQYELVDSRDLLKRYFPDFDILTMAASNNTLSTFSFETYESGTLLTDASGNYIKVEDGGAIRVASQTYYAARQGSRGLQSLNPTVGSTGAGSWYNLYMHRFSDVSTVAGAKSWVDDALKDGKWLITLCHGITATSGDFNMAQADEFFAYVAKKVQTGELWCATFSEATKYIRERQNATVSAVGTQDQVTVEITMTDRTADGLPLPGDVFNMPLTAKVELPAGWRAVTYELNGETKYAEAFTEGSKTYALVNAVPNGGKVSLTPMNVRETTLLPTVAATVVSDGETVTDVLTVSCRADAFVPGYSRRVYAKVSLADVSTDDRVYLPLTVGSDTKATILVYGVKDPIAAAGWTADTLTMENAPAIDYYGKGVDLDGVFGGAPIATIATGGAGVYPIDLTDYAMAIRNGGGTVGSLIFVLEANGTVSLPISFAAVEDVPTYMYKQDFETSNGGLITAGVEAANGSKQEVNDITNHTEGGTRSLMMRLSKTYQRLFLPNILNPTNTATAADIGIQYKVTFWTMATNAGQFYVRMGDGKGRGTAGDQSVTYTVAEEEVGVWIERTYSFEITQTMIDKSYFHLMFFPSDMGQTVDNLVDLCIDDISVERFQPTQKKTICLPSEAKSVGGLTDELSLSVSDELPLPGIHKTYLSFDLSPTALRAELHLSLSGESGRVTLYALTCALPDALTYQNAPGSGRDESMIAADMFHGLPMSTYAANAEVTLNLTELLPLGICTLVLATDDAKSVGVLSPTVTLTAATTNPGYTVTVNGKEIGKGLFTCTLPSTSPLYFDAAGTLYEAETTLDLTADLHLLTPAVALLDGAALRLIGAPALRFDAVLDDATAELLAKNSSLTAEVGMIVLEDSMDALRVTDVPIKAECDDGVYHIDFEIAEGNEATDYAALAVLTLTWEGKTYTFRSEHRPADHVRSLRTVANAAFADRRATADAEYRFETDDGLYSPYGRKELNILRAILEK